MYAPGTSQAEPPRGTEVTIFLLLPRWQQGRRHGDAQRLRLAPIPMPQLPYFPLFSAIPLISHHFCAIPLFPIIFVQFLYFPSFFFFICKSSFPLFCAIPPFPIIFCDSSSSHLFFFLANPIFHYFAQFLRFTLLLAILLFPIILGDSSISYH